MQVHSSIRTGRMLSLMAIATALAVSVSSPVASAAVITWADAGTAWATGSNWSGGIAPADSLVTDIANFNSSSYTNQPDAGTRSVNGITVGGSSGALTVSGTTLSIGQSGLSVASGAGTVTFSTGVSVAAAQTWTNNSTNAVAINGAFSRTSGSTINFAGSGSFTTTTITNTNGIIGPWATYGGNDWATVSGTDIVALNNAAITGESGWTSATDNYTFDAAQTLTGARTANTLRYTGATATLATASFNLTANGIMNAGGGTLTISRSGASNTLNIGASGELVFAGSGDISVSTVISGTGRLIKTGTGKLTLSGQNTFTDRTWINEGVLEGGNHQNIFGSANAARGPVFNGGTFRLTGTAINGSASRVWTINNVAGNTLNVVDAARIAVIGANQDYNTTSSITVSTNTFTGNGTLKKTGSGSFGFGSVNTSTNTISSPTNNFSGVINVEAGSLYTLTPAALGTGTVQLSGGTWQIQNPTGQNYSSNSLIVSANSTVATGGAFSSGALLATADVTHSVKDLNINAGLTVAPRTPYISNNITGTLQVSGATTLTNNATFTTTLAGAGNAGSALILNGAIGNTGGSFGITKAGTGNMTLNAVNTYSGDTTLTGGTLFLGSAASFDNSPVINLNGGNLDTQARSTFATASGQTLRGQGNFAASSTTNIVSGSTLSIGQTHGTAGSAATLNVTSGNITLAGTAQFDLFGYTAGGADTNRDFLNVTNTITYGGTLAISNQTGTAANTFVAGSSWDLFDGANGGGIFSSISAPALASGLVWSFDYTTGVLSVISNNAPITRTASFATSEVGTRRDDISDASDNNNTNAGSQRVLYGIEVDGLNTDPDTAATGSVLVNPSPSTTGRIYVAMWLTETSAGKIDDLITAMDPTYNIRSLSLGNDGDISDTEWNYAQAALGNTSFNNFNVLFAFDNIAGPYFNWDFTNAGVGVDAVAVIPEPTSLALLGLGAAGLLRRRRSR